jgi:predicted nucleotidyltransferase
MTEHSLADSLFTATKQAVLGVLFGHPEQSYHLAEIIKRSNKGTGGVQKELEKLTNSGLVKTWRVGNQRHYQADENSILFHELTGIVLKTVGLRIPVKNALDILEPEIQLAFIYGSVANSTDRSSSDVDLFVVTDSVELEQIYEALQPVEQLLGRTVNPTIYKKDEFDKMRKLKKGFLWKVLQRPIIEILGSVHES